MNMLLLHASDMPDSTTAVIRGRRHEHIRNILKAGPGQSLRVGLVNGPFGTAEIKSIDPEQTELRVKLDESAPAPPRVSVILAMVRPRIARQTLTALASLGVRHIMFINARRVEKPYFSQRLFDGDQYKEFLYLGLEQGIETWLPKVTIHKRFKFFVENELEQMLPCAGPRFVAHPQTGEHKNAFATPRDNQDVILAIGPEGGWIDYEIGKFRDHGFQPLQLGRHILRVETAIPYAFGKLRLG